VLPITPAHRTGGPLKRPNCCTRSLPPHPSELDPGDLALPWTTEARTLAVAETAHAAEAQGRPIVGVERQELALSSGCGPPAGDPAKRRAAEVTRVSPLESSVRYLSICGRSDGNPRASRCTVGEQEVPSPFLLLSIRAARELTPSSASGGVSAHHDLAGRNASSAL